MSQAGKLRDGTALSALETLTGDSGGAVPGAGSPANLNIVGTPGQIVVTGNPGTSTLTISATGGSVSWVPIGASQTMVVETGYFCTTGASLDLTLPVTAIVGSVITVVLDGSTGFHILQGAGQQIRFGNVETTLGATGEIVSTQQGGTLNLVCSVADSRWIVISSVGNFTVV